ncbi:MAG: KpsF/GutQ family sugar-phosphate isomerase [Terrimicrobiaceae bacterium]|nr:KpsF/GutQ family sugar-phosphate isomerase [Terrimicrobiaceae bacterium]
MDFLGQARRVFDIEIEGLRAVAARLDGTFVQAVEALRACVGRRGKIVVVGVGKSGHIGEKIAATLTSTGSPAVVLNSLNALHGDLGIVSDGDVVLALSYSGETDELNNLLPALARFDAGLIAITGNPQSSLARAAGIVLDVRVEQEACPLNLAPTTSTTAMLSLGDALAMVLLEARGFDKDDFARFHPGGQLGRSLLLRVSEIMRGADRLALVGPDESILDTIKVMNSRRAGAAVIVDPAERLLGIFTHGDFARHFTAAPDIANHPVGRFMTPMPVTIRSDRLAAEVLHVLQTRRIDDLVVVDAEGRPVGIIDSQDLSRHKLL